MKKLHKDGFSESLGYESFDACEPCLLGKMTKTPFFGTMERVTDLLEIIHTDVCDPMSAVACGKHRCFLTFTRWFEQIWVYLLDETLVWNSWKVQRISEWSGKIIVTRKIKFLRSDHGDEYLSYEFGLQLKQCGIVSQLTPHGTPQHNGVSERHNRTLLDIVQSMMFLTDLPLITLGVMH